MLVYDLEIVKAIPGDVGIEGIKYCGGWKDHANMGISVLCAYDYVDDSYRVFCEDNMLEFKQLCRKRNCLVSYNGISFDNKVLEANGIYLPEDKCYDILVEIWKGDGLEPTFQYPSHIGYGLDAVSKANFGTKKTGNGAMAPVEWQRNNIGTVIDYCLSDVRLTKKLLDHIINTGEIVHPKSPDKKIRVRRPR